MPKTIKQKNNKRAATFIINSTTNPEVTNNALANIKPIFPPTLTTHDLIESFRKTSSTNDIYIRPKTFPNAYIIYRMALIKEFRNRNIGLPPMGQFSKIAKNSWDKEEQKVKNFYNK